MANARQVAFNALLKTDKEKSYSNIAIDSILTKTKLDTRDKAFVSALFYGVIERKITIDYQLSLYLNKPLNKLKPEVLTILRIGVYQILFMDKVPDSAAVNESVTLSKKNGCSFAGGLINAVLRKVADSGLKLPNETDYIKFLTVKYSCPEEYIELWFSELGKDDTVAFLDNILGKSDICIRVNTTKICANKLIEKLEQEGVKAQQAYLDNALYIDLNGKDIEQLESFRLGYFHVQDISCQICVKALSVNENQRVFDMCSAPGGKAYTAAQDMNGKGEVCCFDIYANRVELIRNGAERLGLSNINALVSDASVYNSELGVADAVLCDAPCSGLGIIRRKPEIKYKSLSSLDTLPEIQYAILDNSAKYVKNGGTLLYSTCTVIKRENEDVCNRFLSEHPDFESVAPLPSISEDKYLTLLPHKNGGDGFFIALFKKKDD